MRKWIIIGVVAVVLAVGATVAVASSSSGSGKKPLLITDTAVVRDLRDEVTVPGTLERAEQRTVSSVSTASATSASASGGASTVNAVYLKDGSALLPGDSILSIDGRKSVAYPGTLPFFRRLDVGAEGSDVLELKTILRDAGFQPGPLDTLYTEQTRFALGQWQASKGYPGASPSTSQAVNVALQQGAGYQLGAQTSAGLTIGPPPAAKAAFHTAAHRGDVSTASVPVLSIGATSATVNRGSFASFVVTADAPLATAVNFSFSVAGTIDTGDLIVPASPVTLAVGSQSTTVRIFVLANANAPQKTLTVKLEDGSDYDPGTPSSATVNVPSSVVPQLTVAGTTSIARGQSAVVTISSNVAAQNDTQVNLNVNGTADPSTDYVPFPPNVVLPAGQSSVTVTVQSKTSTTIKPDRYLVVGLAQSGSYTIGSVSAATITILGDSGDAARPVVTITAGNLRVNAGTPAQFTISLDRPLTQALELTLTYGGDAVQGSDFNPPGGIVTVPPNQSSVAVAVPTLNNGIVQDDRNLTVGIVPESTYTVGSPGSAGIVIVSTTLPKVSIAGSASAVGLGGGAVFRITADQPPVKDTSVQYTVTGTAQQGKDIQPVTGSAVIPAGATTVDVTILTLNTNVFFAPTDMIITTTSGGRLGQVFVKEGQVVPVGTPLFTITEPNIAVTLQASAADRTKLKVGQTATVQVQGSTTTAPGVITQLDDFPTTDTATKKQSFKGTVQVQGDLGAAGGTPVTVNVVVQERKGALTVPIAAVKQNGEGKDVVRIIDLQTGKTREVTVVTGLSEGSYIEVKSGLNAQDVVVVQLDQAKSG